MKGLREVIIDMEPFVTFEFYCAECGENLIREEDIIDGNHRFNEALLMHEAEAHTRETGHTTVEGDIDPVYHMKQIDTTITVNDRLK